MMIQLPVASAGATFMANMIKETFHGMIPATTPKGCFNVKVIMPGVLRLEMPPTCKPIPACKAKMPEQPIISNLEKP